MILFNALFWLYFIIIIIISRLKVTVLSLFGALSDERSGLSPFSHCQQYLVHCQNLI
jgi:hypothetical protein